VLAVESIDGFERVEWLHAHFTGILVVPWLSASSLMLFDPVG